MLKSPQRDDKARLYAIFVPHIISIRSEGAAKHILASPLFVKGDTNMAKRERVTTDPQYLLKV